MDRMSTNDISRVLLSYFAEHCPNATEALSEETELGKEYIMDSLQLVTLSLYLNERFGVEFNIEVDSLDVFETFGSLVIFIEQKRALMTE
jgi:acyl carrier protein